MTETREALEHFYSIIPAGGVGSRLWPLSRADEPKFLLDLTGSGKSLLAATWERLQLLSGVDRTMVVTGYAHREAVCHQLPNLRERNLVLEPQPKDSTAAICLAAAIIARRDPEAIVGSFPADHFINEPREFQRTIRRAIAGADAGYIVTVGITPTGPSEAFGYIHSDGVIEGLEDEGCRHVDQFVEKPDRQTAARYLAEGDYLWNAGMFVARASLLLSQLEKTEPELFAGIQEIADAWDTTEGQLVKERIWGGLKKVAIDYAIAEPSADEGLVGVVPGDFGWDDVGDFSAIAKQMEERYPGNLAILGSSPRVIADKSSGIVVAETNRVVAMIGVEDIIVVDTPDALLVTNKENAQRVKSMVDTLKISGNSDVL